MCGVGQISCTSNPSNSVYSSGTLKHFFNSDLHNSSASSERFSNSPVLSIGRGVTTSEGESGIYMLPRSVEGRYCCWCQVHATVEAVLNFHAKPGGERLTCGAGRPGLGRPS
jgi:hypothetical protein